MFGKRQSATLRGQLARCNLKATPIQLYGELSPAKKAILDFILNSSGNDERPYLHVSIFGNPFLGLLDTGASRTILGRKGWEKLKDKCTLNTSQIQTCMVANGAECQSLGTISAPVTLRNRVCVMDIMVVPSLPHVLILGADFWRRMDIIPDLRRGEWTFGNNPTAVDVCAIQSIEHLSPKQQVDLNALIDATFISMGTNLGCTHLVEHEIKTDSPPIKQRYYPISPTLQKYVDLELDKMISDGIVEPSSSAWASPIVMIKKKDSTYRFCVDYRRLNKVSQRDAYPLPYVSSTLDKLRDARFLSTLDIKSAYWQIPVAESSRPLTAFTVPNRGLFQFRRMPFGLHNAPATWQRLIDRVIGIDLEPFVFTYLDDVIICTNTFEKHIEVLQEVLFRLVNAGLTLNRDKCCFCKPELCYLGYVVNHDGLLVDPRKVEAILQIPTPASVSEVRRIVGMASWYRRFVPNFSTVVSPLTSLLRKNSKFVWDRDCQQALDAIKEHLVSAPILACPDFSLPFIIQTDASAYGLGAVLTQESPDGEKVICYISRSLSKSERNYSTTERECLGVLFAIEKLRPYIEGSKFTVITDHYSLKWLNNIKDPIGRIARWSVRLQQYDFDIIHRKGKDHVVPDTLSRAVPVVDAVDVPNPAELQDPWYLRMIQNITENPRRFPLWRVSDDNRIFKYVSVPYPDLANDADSWKAVIPKDQRQEIISRLHDSPTAGHAGVNKTLVRICQKFYWPKMRKDVASYVRRCEICARTKPEQRAPRGLMGGHTQISRPWEVMCTDIIGPLPRSSRGYTHILVVADCFSKFPLVFPLRAATAAAVTKNIEENVFLLFGAPSRLICDNGVQFRSREFQNMVERYGCKISFTAYYHPQANPTERINRVLKTMLSAYVSDNHRNWDKYLSHVACAIRTSKHEITGLTPYFINFGREISLDQTAVDPDNDLEPIAQDPNVRSNALRKVYIDVKKRLARAYEASKPRYDLRHRPEEFVIGQSVLRKNHVLSDAANYITAKLAPKFIGPFVIHRKLSRWVYHLKDPDGTILPGSWHAKDLKPYLCDVA